MVDGAKGQSVPRIIGIVLVTILVLSLLWEFILEPVVEETLLGFEAETLSERWEFVVGAMVFAAIALVYPMRVVGKAIEGVRAARAEMAGYEARLRTFLETTSDWVWETDAEGRFTVMEGRCLAVTGRLPEWFLGKTAAEAFSRPEGAGTALKAVLEGREAFRDLMISPWMGEARQHLSWNGNPVMDDDGTFRGFRGTGRDLTAFVEGEREADAAQRRLTDAVEALNEGFAFYDAEDRLLLCNERYREIYAVSAPAIVPGAKFEDIIRFGAERGQYKEAEGRVEDFIRERVRLHRNPTGPIDQALGDGRWLRIEERRTADGGIVGMRADITALKKAEQRLLDAIENIPDGFVLWDEKDRLVMCNEIYVRYLDKVADKVVPGVTFSELLEAALNAGQFAVRGDKEAWLDEIRDYHQHPEGSREIQMSDGRWFLASDRRTSEGGTVGIRTDITESVNANEVLTNRSVQLASSLEELDANTRELERFACELERERDNAKAANLAKSQFLSNMSHELRTPLNAIMGFSEIIRMQMFGALGSPQYEDYASSIHDSASHLLEIINDILDVSKIEAGKYELHREGVIPADVVADAIKLVGPKAGDGGVTIEVDVPRNLPVAYVDRRAVKQILVNLLSNAIKFTARDGRIEIRAVVEEEGWLVLEVRDSGVGIPEAQLSRIFEPFVQVAREEGRFHEGTGLGLSLSKALIAMHDGRIEVASREGEGTVVRVILPSGEKMIWLPAFSVGIEHLDRDHRAIFRMIDRLVGAARAGTVDGSFRAALDHAVGQIRVHFRSEEAAMERLDYPRLADHRSTHGQFLDWAEEVVRAEGRLAGPDEVKAVTDELVGWWFDHVLHHDMHYKAWFERSRDDVEEALAAHTPLPVPWLGPDPLDEAR